MKSCLGIVSKGRQHLFISTVYIYIVRKILIHLREWTCKYGSILLKTAEEVYHLFHDKYT